MVPRDVIAVGLLLLASFSARAEDVLILKNGREARGQIVEETEDKIRLRMGSGSMWYPRSALKEIQRDEEDAAPAKDAEKATYSRDEQGLLYRDGVRVGTRTLHVVERADHIQFEEQLDFLGKDDEKPRTVRVVERCDRQFQPLFLQLREIVGEESRRLIEARVTDGQIVRNAMIEGRRELATSPVATGGRFPMAAREHFFREHEAMGGKLSILLFDINSGRFVHATYEDRGPKRVESTEGALNPEVFDVRVIERRRGSTVEREWLSDDRATRLSELDGESLRYVPAPPPVVDRVRKGDPAEAGSDAAARTRHLDTEHGFAIGKPDPSWKFERPDVEGAGALIVVHSEQLSASVDVLQDPVKREKLTAEGAAESLQRVCRAASSEFRVVEEHYVEGPYGREYVMVASAVTKGERTRTLARVVVKGDRAWRLLAACPERWFDLCKPDFEKVLKSFELL